MKNFILLVVLSLFLANCTNPTYTNDNYSHLIDLEHPPVIKFDKDTFDFGRVTEGSEVSHKYYFTNEGPGMLLISDVSTSCGCTVPKNWPKEPIHPGERAYIEVYFNTNNRIGVNKKHLTVLANTKPQNNPLLLMGEVVGPE